MEDKEEPVYKFYAEDDHVFIKVNGRAYLHNCVPLKQFMKAHIAAGGRHFAIDFKQCSSMDSTFLGILVGVVLELLKAAPPGSMTLLQLGERNLDVVRNLGVHRLVSVDSNDATMNFSNAKEVTSNTGNEQVDEDLVRDAHLRLSELNENNARLFQDVIGFLEMNQEDQT